jgi:N-methylhydantoinase B/oxoprolinase/acetone carboxylase alpha subunit
VPAQGIFGGYPGSGVYFGAIAESGAWEALQEGQILTFPELEKNTWQNFKPEPSKAVWPRDRHIEKGAGGDVFVMTFVAGGGYGDPLDRDPVAVSADVSEGYVSSSAAKSAYGVVLNADGRVDEESTKKLRAQLRDDRITSAVCPAEIS